MASIKGNRKVAKNRSETWKKKLLVGKLQAALNPTNIKMKRVEKGIPQTTMAKELSVSLATYGNIERGKIGVKFPLASFISQFLGLTLDKTFKKNGEKYIAIKVK